MRPAWFCSLTLRHSSRIFPQPQLKQRNRNCMKSYLIPALAFGLFASPMSAQNKADLKDPRQKISYALGMEIASSLKRDDVDIDMNAVAAGMADMQAGKPAFTPEQQKTVMMDMKTNITAKAEAKKKIAAVKNLKLGQAFLAANAKKEGVKVLEVTAPDGSKAEVQYKVLKSGTGPAHDKADVLKLHYQGSLIDGTVFDSSVQRDEPWEGRATGFIVGWAEPLQMMKVGDKWRLFVPPSLGYGEYMPYNIGPNSTLIYDIELLGIEKPGEVAPAANALTPPTK